MAKKRSARRTTSSGLARLSVTDLQREIRRRQRGVKALLRRRGKLLAKIASVEAQIMDRAGTIAAEAGLATARPGTGRTRPKNETSLIDALKAALKGKTMGVDEAVDAVLKSGYRTSAANFKVMVNANLGKKKHFKRVERGRYTAV